MKHLQGTTVLVLGLGESGLAMARWAARCGAVVRVWDSRETAPNAAALAEHVPAAQLLRGAGTKMTGSTCLNFNVFADMNREISCCMAKLNDPFEAAALIDHAIQQVGLIPNGLEGPCRGGYFLAFLHVHLYLGGSATVAHGDLGGLTRFEG